jgi:hypothetical protein
MTDRQPTLEKFPRIITYEDKSSPVIPRTPTLLRRSGVLTQSQITQLRNDASTRPTINVAELLKDISNEQTQHIEGQTIESIARSIYDSLSLNVPANMVQPFYEKLAGFRYIDKVYLLHRGKYVRWIRNNTAPPKLENGGIVVDTKITDNGVVVLCKFGSRFTQYRFNECITYQKLSPDEMLVLSAYSAM